jgi:tetratricopeptide (TPR) repeat protein
LAPAWKYFKWALDASPDLPPGDRALVVGPAVLGAVATDHGTEANQLLQGETLELRRVLAKPYAGLGQPLFSAVVDLAAPDPDTKLRAAEHLEQLAAQVDPKDRATLLEPAASAYLDAADLLFINGEVERAKQAYGRALLHITHLTPALRHNRAVLSYYSGDQQAALAELKALKAALPLAACNLGVHYERAYLQRDAYKLFRECKQRGGHFPGLREILADQQRVYGR